MTPEGKRQRQAAHLQQAADKMGCTVEEMLAREAAGEAWCAWHKQWQPATEFRAGINARTGLASYCAPGHAEYRKSHVRTPRDTKRPHGGHRTMQAASRVARTREIYAELQWLWAQTGDAVEVNVSISRVSRDVFDALPGKRWPTLAVLEGECARGVRVFPKAGA